MRCTFDVHCSSLVGVEEIEGSLSSSDLLLSHAVLRVALSIEGSFFHRLRDSLLWRLRCLWLDRLRNLLFRLFSRLGFGRRLNSSLRKRGRLGLNLTR